MEFKKIKGNLIHKSAIINWDKVKIGTNNIIGPYCIIGSDAQHTSERSSGYISIGNKNIIRVYNNPFTNKIKKKNNRW